MRLTRRQTLAAIPATAVASLAAVPMLAPICASADTRTIVEAGASVGPRGANHRVLDLGDVEVIVLLDDTVPMSTFGPDGPHSIFGVNVDAETFAEVSRRNFLSPDEGTSFFHPVLVRTGKNLILFDTGLGRGGLGRAITGAGHAPGDITHVVLTHLHSDHIGGLLTDGSPTFPNAQHITGETEMNYFSSNPNAELRQVLSMRDWFELVNDGAEIAPGVTALAAPGHTPGHMVYRVDSNASSLLIFADTANHHVWSLAYPEWEAHFDMDSAMAARTRRKLLDMLASERMPFTGYHMPFPSVGYVETAGDGFRYVPESYQFL